MEQLTQKLKDGETRVQEVVIPQTGPGMLLVRNHYSVISAGTEGATANTARKSLLAKAKERPQQVQQVFEVLRKQGPLQTWRAVTKKLEAYSPCGYSSAGEVIAVGEEVIGFAVGDKVACAGVGYANHAEVVAVPVNLCVKLDPRADLAAAAYNTLGAIAMQGVRQADLRLGENALVIGLGLIGRLAVQFLRASGVRVIGVDVSSQAVKAAESELDLALLRNEPGIEEKIAEFTGGNGVDAVIVTAATSSLDPVNFSGKVSRRKGAVVIVGAVPTGFDRDMYYKKELTLKMSCSYGPGRYDLDYEEKGIDYPIEYVRWTEKRNMEAFQQLLLDRKVDVTSLTTHRFPFERATDAYELIVRRNEPFTGIVLEYDVEKPLSNVSVPILKEKKSVAGTTLGIAFIGAGSYAQGQLLPNLPLDLRRIAVLTNSGTTSKRVAERFHFEKSVASEEEILNDRAIETVFIATRHDSHADYVVQMLNAGKNVFVEKPLALTTIELNAVEQAYKKSDKQLLVGFNRRFSPLSLELKRTIGDGLMSMIFRVNAGSIPASEWIQDPALGGGRIVGEGCHFIDYMTFICGSLPKKIYASALPDPQGMNDTTNITIEFANGSIGVVAYYANGSKKLDKEYFEVHHAGISGILRDFRELAIYGRGAKKMKRWSQDKGQAAMMTAFMERLKNGGAPLIPFTELRAATLASFAVSTSLRENAPILLTE